MLDDDDDDDEYDFVSWILAGIRRADERPSAFVSILIDGDVWGTMNFKNFESLWKDVFVKSADVITGETTTD